MNNILKWFNATHLPKELQYIAAPVAALAHAMDTALIDGSEKAAGMRKLLEAKDCFVRAKIDGDE